MNKLEDEFAEMLSEQKVQIFGNYSCCRDKKFQDKNRVLEEKLCSNVGTQAKMATTDNRVSVVN
jgi:hypothetical protein